MNWYYWFAVVALMICLISLIYHLIRLIKLGAPRDFSKKMGQTGPAIRYAFTGAMNPMKKESAFLHLPTYTAGIIYHVGTFLSIGLFFLFIFRIEPLGIARDVLIVFLLISGLCGLGIWIKRITLKKMRILSNPDDYISNILVTVFHFFTAITLLNVKLFPVYFILAGILLLYLPLGKLKHVVFFFAARYHLGLFYGWRGIWPPK
jgi:hypothetical protein